MWGDIYMEPLVPSEVDNLETVWFVIFHGAQKVGEFVSDHVSLQIALLIGICSAAADIVLFLQNREDK